MRLPWAESTHPLHRNTDRNADVRISLVIHVIAIVCINDVNIFGFVPVIRPVGRPWVNHAEPVSAVLEAREAANNHIRLAIDNKRMSRTKVAVIAVVRNTVSVVAAPLLPRPVIGLPVS